MRPRAFALLLVAQLLSSTAAANTTGITGYSGRTAKTCTSCHSPSGILRPQVTLSGATSVASGVLVSYTLTLTSTWSLTQRTGGLGVSASGGTLMADPTETSTAVRLGELVHTKPKARSGNDVQWRFGWRAPTTPGTYVIYGAAVAANGDARSGGDGVDTATLSVTVAGCFSDRDCNDNDACTQDTCDRKARTCQFTPIGGCCSKDADCADTNVCTQDTCSPLTRRCVHAAIAACCTADAQCVDTDVCTLDRCDLAANRCNNSRITGCCLADGQCVDGNRCTRDTCDATTHRCVFYPTPGCCKVDADCTDSSACTQDTCNVATGICLNAAIAGCCQTAVDCDDKNLCTTDTCASNVCANAGIKGCCLSDSQCTDGNACTRDTCDVLSHACVYTAIPGCAGPDSGTLPRDAGQRVDARPPADRGQDRPAAQGPDGRTLPDGRRADRGKLQRDSTWAWPDGSASDRGGPQDGWSGGGDTGAGAPADDGCCRVSHGRGELGLPVLVLLGVLLLIAWRRRR